MLTRSHCWCDRCSCSKRAGIVISSKGRFFSVLCFTSCKLKADEKTPCRSSGHLYAFWWFTPPFSQVTVGRAVGRARGIWATGLRSGSSFCSLASVVSVLCCCFSRLQLLSWLSCLGRCVLIFREAEVSEVRASGPGKVKQHIQWKVHLYAAFFGFRSVILYWVFRGSKMI